MHGLLPNICPLLQLHHTEVPWPFISNFGYCKFCIEKAWKSEKVMFYRDCVPEKVSRSVKWMVCFPIYVLYCNCITQKSNNDLFQISRFCPEKARISEKMMFHCDGGIENVSRSVKFMVCFQIYVNDCNRITQKSHDNLFQILRQPGSASFVPKKQENPKKWCFTVTV